MKNETKQNLKEQIKVMEAKLKEAAEQLPMEELIVEYDNGGGQSGIRENPFFSAYEKLMACYLKSINTLNGMGANEEPAVDSINDLKKKFKIAK